MNVRYYKGISFPSFTEDGPLTKGCDEYSQGPKCVGERKCGKIVMPVRLGGREFENQYCIDETGGCLFDMFGDHCCSLKNNNLSNQSPDYLIIQFKQPKGCEPPKTTYGRETDVSSEGPSSE